MKIPATVLGLGGMITVTFVKNLKHKKEKIAGLWSPKRREISIDKSGDDRDELHTFFHEQMHAALDDSGMHNLLTDESKEALCDLVAMMRLRELGM